MVVIIQNDEQLLQLTSTIISDRLEDLDQVVVGQASGQSGHSLDEGQGSRTLRGLGSRNDDNDRPGIVPLDVEAAAGVRLHVVGAELAHDGHPDARVQGHLVSNRHWLQMRRLPDRICL